MRVHPDKNPSEEARQAFEALNKAHRLLRDPGQLVSWQPAACSPCTVGRPAESCTEEVHGLCLGC